MNVLHGLYLLIGAFYNTFDMHEAMIGLKKQFLVFLGVDVFFTQVLLIGAFCNTFDLH